MSPSYRGSVAVGALLLGVVGGLLAATLLTFIGEPRIRQAIAIETAKAEAANSGPIASEPEIVSRSVQKGVGLFAGRDPYAATFLHGSLAARPLGTKTHFPYLPGMLPFGVPRALDGRSPLSDARLPFAAATLAAFGLAAARWPGRSTGRLRTAQVLLVLPTGALLMATGGDDLPVLGLMLASLVYLPVLLAAMALDKVSF